VLNRLVVLKSLAQYLEHTESAHLMRETYKTALLKNALHSHATKPSYETALSILYLKLIQICFMACRAIIHKGNDISSVLLIKNGFCWKMPSY